jgi:hypothetical protein
VHAAFTLGLNRGEWSASRSDLFTLDEGIDYFQWTGDLGRRVGLDGVETKVPVTA